MAGMGTLQRLDRPNTGKASDYISGMAALLGKQLEAYNQVGDAVEGYGQSRARGKAADLIGSEEYQNAMTPGEAEAMLMQATGGRNLGEEGTKMLKRSGDNKTDAWANEEDIKASTVLFGRQQQRDAVSNANQNARQARGFAHSKAMQKLRGNGSGGAAKLTGKQFADNMGEIRDLESGIKTQKDPIAKAAMQERIDELKFNTTRALDKTPSNYMNEELLGIKKNKGRKRSAGGGYSTPKWGGKLYSTTDSNVRDFINSKYGREVTEGKDGYYFRGQKLTPAYLADLKG